MAEQCAIVITMLPHGGVVQSVTFGPDGLAAGFRPGSLLLDTSSAEPWLTKDTAARLAEQGLRATVLERSAEEAYLCNTRLSSWVFHCALNSVSKPPEALAQAIAEATGNGRLAAMIAQLLDQMTRLLHLGLGLRTRAQQATHEHRALLKALTRGDGEAAQRISREEIEATRGMVLSAIMTSNTVMNLAITGD